jgi:hypothetical protein
VLQQELRSERESRARDRAQAKANEERLQAQIIDVELKNSNESQDQLALAKQQLAEKDERLAKATAEYTAMREKAKEAIGKLKLLDERLKAGGGENKEQLNAVREKYNEVVGKLKAQAELNKKIDEKYRELAEKHRKAIAMLNAARVGNATEATYTGPDPSKVAGPG